MSSVIFLFQNQTNHDDPNEEFAKRFKRLTLWLGENNLGVEVAILPMRSLNAVQLVATARGHRALARLPLPENLGTFLEDETVLTMSFCQKQLD